MKAKSCAVIVQRPKDLWEATRTSLGLAAHNHYAYLYVLDFAVDMTEALRENLDWLTEMECVYYSNVEANAEHSFTYIPLHEMAAELRKMDLIIPFGKRQHAAGNG